FSKPEPLRPGQRDVQFFAGVCRHEREVKVELALAADREIALEFGKVLIAGDIANLHGAVSAEALEGGELYRAFAGLKDGKRVWPGVDEIVIEAVTDQGGGRASALCRGGAGGERGDEEGYKPDLYCSSQVCHTLIFCSRSAQEAPGSKPLVCPV